MIKRTALLFLVSIIITAAVCVILATSEAGLRLLVSASEKVSKGRLKVESVSGTLAGRFTLNRMSLALESGDFFANKIVLVWGRSSFIKPIIHINLLSLQGTEWNAVSNSGKTEAKGGDIALPNFALPVMVKIDTLAVADASFAEEGKEVFQVDNGRVEIIAEGSGIEIGQFMLQGENYRLDLSGKLQTAGDWPIDVRCEGRFDPGSGGWVSAEAALSQSLKEGKAQLKLLSPFSGDIEASFTLGKTATWNAEIWLKNIDPSLYFSDLPGDMSIHLLSAGEVDGGSIEAELQIVDLMGSLRSHPLRGRAKLGYSQNTLTISDTAVSTQQSEVSLRGSVGPDLNIFYRLSSPDLKEFFPEIEGAVEAEGNIRGSLSSPAFMLQADGRSISIRGDAAMAKVKIVAGGKVSSAGEMEIELTGQNIAAGGRQLETAGVRYAGSLKEHNLQLQITEKELNTTVEIDGGLSDKQWHGVMNKAELAHYDKGKLILSKPVSILIEPGGGSISNFCFSHKSGAICGEGGLRGNKWNVNAVLSSFDPLFFFPDWPGSIDAELAGEGKLVKSGISGEIEIAGLAGYLRNYQLKGWGTVNFDDERVDFEGLNVHYGGASLAVDGTLGERSSIAFSGKIPDLSLLLPESAGSLSFSGQMSGSKWKPSVKLDVSAHNGRFGDGRLRELTGVVDVDLEKQGRVNGEIFIKDAQWGDHSLQSSQIRVSGTADEHSFSLDASNKEFLMTILGKGRYAEGWRAVLESGALVGSNSNRFFISNNPEIQVSPSGWGVSELCVSGEGFEGCIAGEFEDKKGGHVNAKIDQFPLNLLNDLGIVALPVGGSLGLGFGFVMSGDMQPELDAWVKSDSITLSGEFADDKLVSSFSDTAFHARFQDSSFNFSIESGLDGGGKLRGEARIDDVQFERGKTDSLPIEGTLAVSLKDLSLITLLTNSQVIPKGRLEGDLNFHGTLGSPEVDGRFRLDEGEAGIPSLGISLSDVSINLDAVPGGLSFDLKAKSGKGSAEAKGKMALLEDEPWNLETTVKGSFFEFLKSEEYNIYIDSDVVFSCDQNGGSLAGSIIVPYARIKISDKKGRISPSRDVVIIDDVSGGVRNVWQLRTNIRLDLGDDVNISAYGLESGLQGSLSLIDEPDKNFSAEGELEVVDGKFSLYSTKLDIERGRLMFAGGSVDNPGVDFRAQRVIEDKIVGVDVSGSAKDLQFELFSIPVMEESDIIAYMVVGKSMYGSAGNDQSLIRSAATAIGLDEFNKITSRLGEYLSVDEIYLDGSSTSEDMSLVVGKYIGKDLFVGYDQNLFNNNSELRINYRIGKGFAIETKTSVDSTSGDIIYTIEK